MRDVTIREVGPRDGLQMVKSFCPSAAKQAWIAAEAAAGVTEIQVCSFVPVKVIPQFADCGEVVAHALLRPGLIVSALAPNLKGAQRGFEAGVHKLGYVLSASESHNLSNVRRSTDESLLDFKRIVELRNSNEEWRNVRLAGGISTAFGCTIEGEVSADVVMRLAEKYVEYGADELNVADTVGYANPGQVRDLFTRLRSVVGDVPVSAHFHDTRGLGLANSYAALEAGITTFDACLGGMGGCPFAPGASGNVVTEDLVFMFEAMGLRTGIDLDRLIAVREIIQEALPGEPLYGAIARAKPPKGFRAASSDSAR
ncbi:MAG TPA: hydroxymethylglutaryl-CoA lyase [Blastocatellia bacterium]|nr:hydroxymethylglutaryl-CoA lyase [Blastocatellia bacterium]